MCTKKKKKYWSGFSTLVLQICIISDMYCHHSASNVTFSDIRGTETGTTFFFYKILNNSITALPQKKRPSIRKWFYNSRMLYWCEYPLGAAQVPLTDGEVAAESRGRIPPHAIMMLSTIWEMRWMVLWTNIMFSLLFTKSMTDFVEWLRERENKRRQQWSETMQKNITCSSVK